MYEHSAWSGSPRQNNANNGPPESQNTNSMKRNPILSNPEINGPASLTGSRPSATEPQPAKPPPTEQVQIDDSEAIACYANFCRVMGTPEELIIDFGLNPQPFGVPTKPIAVTQRIVTNLYTAKRLLHVLHMTVQRHEATFGAIETDVQKRARRE
jgi:hypothetical protein